MGGGEVGGIVYIFNGLGGGGLRERERAVRVYVGCSVAGRVRCVSVFWGEGHCAYFKFLMNSLLVCLAPACAFAVFLD